MANVIASGTLAVLLPLGGYMGYSKKNSVASLAAGVSAGLISAVSLIYLLSDSNHKVANRVEACMSFLLSAVMAFRYLKSRKPTPLYVSLLTGICFLFGFAPYSF
ncbi:Transmembrane proteins 14C, putative [Trypanosoma equiperdum]|uniref:Transmembrane proteins 14C n=2 Tax=Trypanozoon TaxID=39700 RepID=Q381S7_TRYB2|nr:hypothetical protein, conserved [Trypanosoma brucei brucei TREU927]EAN80454.1 hypothetical protein, conserved [Trypanosoma brucei brucei TREU927]SCU72077.1 Transmembrane proteins 14C, putative [Trypanosoma equiperdum]